MVNNDLERDALTLLKNGVYDPQAMFKILYNRHAVHYSRVREAIHNAKQQ